MVRVKVCGVTRLEDAVGCVEAGVDAIGLNFWPSSVRRCDDEIAREIARAVGARVRLVAVVVDAPGARLEAIRALGVDWIQLHGAEPPDELERWLPRALKAVHLDSDAGGDAAAAYGGDEILVDARLGDLPGGTGRRCDWDAAAEVAARRRTWLAGGLRADDVAEAVARVRPFGVDVASGVESAPGVKDLDEVARFVRNARNSAR